MDPEKRALIYALLTVALWSTVASAFKISLRYLSPEVLLLYSSLTSLIILNTHLIIRKLIGVALRWENLKRAAVLGALNPALYYLVLFHAYSLLPAQEAQPLNQTWVIIMALFSTVVLGQRLSLKRLLAIIISFTGVFVISTRGDVLSFHISSPLGVLLALSSAVIWSLFWLYSVRWEERDEVKLALNFTFGSLYIILYLLLRGMITLPSSQGLLTAVYVGAVEMGFAYILWLRAISTTSSAAKVSHMIYLVPPLSLIVIHFVVGEDIYPSTVVGLGLILGGILLSRYLEGPTF
ncbi:MAG: DMT family transporter [Thermoplasmata archaeon]|nr:DMT family transporter [Thermoplasmata archaeon]